MPLICCVPECRGNYRNGLRVSVFGFPKEETLVAKWLIAIKRDDFRPSKFSRVCELHFEASQIIREASAFDPRTGRTLTAPLVVPRLRKGAVPTLFMPSSGTGVRSRLDSNKLVNEKKKNQLNEKTMNEETKETDGSELAKLLQTDSGNEFQPVAEPSIVIKQEPVESANEAAPLVIQNVLSGVDLTSSLNKLSASNCSSSSINSPPSPENASPIASPKSASVNGTPATSASNKLSKKRKISDIKPDGDDLTLKDIQAKFRRRSKLPTPTKRNRPHPSSRISKISAGHSRSDESGAKEMFQSLVSESKNNPSSGSITGEKPGDLFDVFADFIADKLREMNWDNCAYALRAILDIVFKTGQLQQDSEADSDISDTDSSSASSHEE